MTVQGFALNQMATGHVATGMKILKGAPIASNTTVSSLVHSPAGAMTHVPSAAPAAGGIAAKLAPLGSMALKNSAPIAAVTTTIMETGDVVEGFREGRGMKEFAKTGVTVGGTVAGAKAGAAIGAAIGSVVPVVGTLGGALIGSVLGAVAGNRLSDSASSAVLGKNDGIHDSNYSVVNPELAAKEGYSENGNFSLGTVPMENNSAPARPPSFSVAPPPATSVNRYEDKNHGFFKL